MGLQNLPYVIEQIISRKLSEIHTCMPGQIVDYDYTTQKASVQPCIKKQYLDNTDEQLPIISNVPVIWPRASNCSLTFPLLENVYVLLCFTERALELFLNQGGIQKPGDTRQFNLTDCIAIPGFYPFSENSLATNNTDVLLVYKDSSIRIEGASDKFPNENDGAIDIVGSQNFNVTITKDQLIKIGGNSEIDITGNSKIQITGTSELDITGKSTINMLANSNINIGGNSVVDITGSSNVTIGGGSTVTITGDSVVDISGALTVSTGATISIVATGNVDLTSPQTTIHGAVVIDGGTTINGALQVNSTIVATGDIKAGSISLEGHKHSGVTTGGGNTGAAF
jgi:hypothetical protein